MDEKKDFVTVRAMETRDAEAVSALIGRGIGRLLCGAVESWSRVRGVSVVRVTSRSTRADAHRFYLRDGYSQVKTSLVFEKRV